MKIIKIYDVSLVANAPLSCRINVEKESRVAAQQNPCETCLRWEECNGVDKNCPLCIGDKE